MFISINFSVIRVLSCFSKMSYFAVNKGRRSMGTYDESGLKDKVYLLGPDSKGSKAETGRFVETSSSSPDGDNIQKNEFKTDNEGFVEAYTDGACSKSGSADAKAGIGVWFGDDSPHNVSKPASDCLVNTTAEAEAVTEAAKIVQRAGESKIKIYTDSQFVMKNVDQGMIRYENNGWLNVRGEPMKDKEKLIEMEAALKSMDVKLEYVKGHEGVYGNEKADELAREGVKKQ